MAHIGKARIASILARRLTPTKSPGLIEALTLDILDAFEKHTEEAATALSRMLDKCAEVPKGALEVDSLEERRDIIEMREPNPEDPGKIRIKELAVGDTTHTLFVRSPTVGSGASGKKKLHAVRISAELYEELFAAGYR